MKYRDEPSLIVEVEMAKKGKMSTSQQRSLRTQQIVMGVIGVMVILAMVLSMIR